MYECVYGMCICICGWVGVYVGVRVGVCVCMCESMCVRRTCVWVVVYLDLWVLFGILN